MLPNGEKWRLRQWARTPFPLALDDPGSVLAVKGPLRRFAPWTAPGRSEGRRCSRGERGDTDQPHIDWGEASGLIFGWTLLGYASC